VSHRNPLFDADRILAYKPSGHRNLQRSIDLCTVIVDPELEVHETITKADYDVLESEAGEPEVLWLDEYLSRVKESVLEGYRRGGTKGFEV
jgi:hypothetical protein